MNLTREFTKEALDPSNDVISLPKGVYNVYPNPRDPPYKDTQPSGSPLCEP